MTETIFKYPLDLSGTSVDNRAIDEAHTIGATRARIFATDYGPFFGSNVIIKDAISGNVLQPNIDYYLVHYYREASEAAGQAIYAAVRIVNPDVGTEILITPQYVGGEFSYSTFAIKQAIEGLLVDNRPVYWGDLVGLPSQFVPTPHLHSAYDLYGLKYLIESEYDIASAIREGDTASRQVLLDQMSRKFDDLDAFTVELADLFRQGAVDLAAI